MSGCLSADRGHEPVRLLQSVEVALPLPRWHANNGSPCRVALWSVVECVVRIGTHGCRLEKALHSVACSFRSCPCPWRGDGVMLTVACQAPTAAAPVAPPAYFGVPAARRAGSVVDASSFLFGGLPDVQLCSDRCRRRRAGRFVCTSHNRVVAAGAVTTGVVGAVAAPPARPESPTAAGLRQGLPTGALTATQCTLRRLHLRVLDSACTLCKSVAPRRSVCVSAADGVTKP